MAIQAQMYNEENLGFALMGGPPQGLLMENGYGFSTSLSFIPQQQKPKQQQHQLVQLDQLQNINDHQKNMFLKNSTNGGDHHHHQQQQQQSMAFPQSVTVAHVEKQRTEIDRFITLQNERLRMALQEQRKQQVAHLMKNYESRTKLLIKQKEEEIAKASHRTMELQEFLQRIEMENQTWQRVAKENESMVASLNTTIKRLRETTCASSSANAAEDAESCCNESAEENEEKHKTRKTNKMVCKSCHTRKSCVVMLPCRHLCSCMTCDAFLDSCPVCKMVKRSSIEAFV